MTATDAVQPRIHLPRAAIEDFCRRWQLKELALFGSVLRHDFTAESDVDVLVTLDTEARQSLFDLVDMREELAALLHHKVDLVTKGSLRNPYRRHEILTTRQVLHPEIPWRKIIAQRNVLAHEYGEVEPSLVWVLVTDHLPRLVAQLEPLLPPPPSEG
jgi:predicted nucleotidyltransferase